MQDVVEDSNLRAEMRARALDIAVRVSKKSYFEIANVFFFLSEDDKGERDVCRIINDP